MKKISMIISVLLALGLLLGACATNAPAPAPEGQKTTITVWDYYGEATPIKPLLEGFQAANPNITVQYESLDWDSTLDKLNVILTGGTPPDVVTIDMTWLPNFASLNAFADLKPLSGGKLNGVAWEDAYTPGGLESITYEDKIVAALYDFDVYALYYRADLLEEKGLEVPTNWQELLDVSNKLNEGDLYKYLWLPYAFHATQWIYENGGSLLSSDNKTVKFNEPEAVEGVQAYADMLTKGKAIFWGGDEGEPIRGIKDGRVAMFSDGPYMMGVMKSGAPELAGKWRVTQHPFNKQPGSYLGGTGLVIPSGSKNQEAAWKFIEYAMTLENQIGVYKNAGAAPALTAALESPEVNSPDEYMGGQKPFEVFLESMKTAHHMPYVRQWTTIDEAFGLALEKIGLQGVPVQEALDEAAKTSQDALNE